MFSPEQLVAWVGDAYEHLYDLVYLRRHPLLDLLAPEPGLSAKDRAWRAHQALLEAIDALDPGPQAPLHSREARRHRLMVLRYVDGLEVQAVADELGISKRHYFREHDAAIQAIASLLPDSQTAPAGQETPQGPTSGGEPPLARLELLRLETARLSRSRRQVDLREVALGVLQVAREMAKQRGVTIDATLAGDLPRVAADGNTLRQLLLGLLGYLLERMEPGRLRLEGRVQEGQVVFSLRGTAAAAPEGDAEEGMPVRLLRELAAALHAGLEAVGDPGPIRGFVLRFPLAAPRTILIVDDNEDALRLLSQYLSQHGYQVIAAQTGDEAIEAARDLQPYAVTLDLMMPDRDGWDVLQTLANQPATQHIPIVVCTVLAAKEMALSLGAAAFLPKPVSEQTLLATLAALE